MLRKLVWSALFAAIAGATATASQKVAATAWRLATGDKPPDTSS